MGLLAWTLCFPPRMGLPEQNMCLWHWALGSAQLCLQVQPPPVSVSVAVELIFHFTTDSLILPQDARRKRDSEIQRGALLLL